MSSKVDPEREVKSYGTMEPEAEADLSAGRRGHGPRADPNAFEYPHVYDLDPANYDSSCEPLRDPRQEQIAIDPHGKKWVLRPHDNNPRRLWDICANKVIPAAWLKYVVQGLDVLNPERGWQSREHVDRHMSYWAISHSWVAENDREYVFTSVNNYQWPVPMPRGVTIESLREELIQIGCRYVWLDVLCMRQDYPQHLLYHLRNDEEERQKREKLRVQEWKTDVPTIGAIYRSVFAVVTYFNGLGKPFQPHGWRGDRHWLQRTWTLQETLLLNKMIIGGASWLDARVNLLDYQVNQEGLTLGDCLHKILKALQSGDWGTLLQMILARHASNPVDKVAGIISLAQSSQRSTNSLPVYEGNETAGQAWHRWLSGTKTASSSFWQELMLQFPPGSRQYWFPSWHEVMLRLSPEHQWTCNAQSMSLQCRTSEPTFHTPKLEVDMLHQVYRFCRLRQEGTGLWSVTGKGGRVMPPIHGYTGYNRHLWLKMLNQDFTAIDQSLEYTLVATLGVVMSGDRLGIKDAGDLVLVCREIAVTVVEDLHSWDSLRGGGARGRSTGVDRCRSATFGSWL